MDKGIEIIGKLVTVWMVSVVISLFAGVIIGGSFVTPEKNKADYKDNLEIINTKLDLLKSDTNSILYNESKLTICKLQRQAYKDRLLYLYNDNENLFITK